MQTVVILANGQPPVHPTPLALLSNADLLICCDGACLTAQRLGRGPHFIVGDGDSIPPAERAAWADRFILIGEQDTNDLDKAFRFALSRQPVPFHLALLGTTGLREDHTLGNIFRLAFGMAEYGTPQQIFGQMVKTVFVMLRQISSDGKFYFRRY